MNRNDLFAVVDLETTGNSIKREDRIIQFGCSIIKNGQIVKNFSTNVNPELKIPQRITQLTGISDLDVKGSPTFAQLSDKIVNLLKGCVFVAHNVNFDFPFLNYELHRVGKPELTIQAVDTVTMSQILLPNLPSYRLRDLTQYFNIVHQHPHAAISDAHATAQLFLLLLQRLYSLPKLTLKSILGLKLQLPQSTLELFKNALTYQRQVNHKLPTYFCEVAGLVLRKSTLGVDNVNKSKKSSEIKKHWLWKNFDRPFKEQKNLIIEEPMDFNTVLDRLTIMLNLARSHHQQLVISVSNRNAIAKLLNQYLPLINEKENLTFARFRPVYHLLDLKRFKATLFEPVQSNQFQLLKARLLIWLTITETGDLSELSMSSIPYLDEIRYLNFPQLDPDDDFYNEDFAHRQLYFRSKSDCVVTTHKYLYQHHRLAKQPYLLLFKPLLLPKIALQESKQTITLNHVSLLVRQLKSHVINSHFVSLNDLLPSKQIKKIMEILEEIDINLKLIQKNFSHRFLGKGNLVNDQNHLSTRIDVNSFKWFINENQEQLNAVNSYHHALIQISNDEVMKRAQQVPIQQRYLFNYYWTQLTLLNQEIAKYTKLKQFLVNDSRNTFFSVKVRQPHDINNCELTGTIRHLHQRLKNRIYRFHQPIVAFSPFYSNHVESKRLVELLNLPRNNTLFKRFNGVKKNGDFHLLSGVKSIDNFAYRLAELVGYHHLKILVVVNSYSMIDQFYYQWSQLDFTDTFNVLGEGVNANPNKLYKNVINDSEVIGIVNDDLITSNPELIDAVNVVIFVGHKLNDYYQMWLKETLGIITTTKFVGMANFDSKLKFPAQIKTSSVTWEIQTENYAKFNLEFNKFLQNLQKGRA